MELTNDIVVENGFIMAEVSTNKVGSECEFEVCLVEDFEEMSEDEFDKVLIQSMWESGYIDVYLKRK